MTTTASVRTLLDFAERSEHYHAVIDYMEELLWSCIYTRQVLYAAEVMKKRVARTPETQIAKLWNASFGARTIPFDATARRDLIAEGSKHPELKRHIAAWKKMKRDRSRGRRRGMTISTPKSSSTTTLTRLPARAILRLEGGSPYYRPKPTMPLFRPLRLAGGRLSGRMILPLCSARARGAEDFDLPGRREPLPHPPAAPCVLT